MEFSILYAIPRSAVWDSFFLTLTDVVGSYGQLYLILGILLLLFRKTRKMGAAVIISYIAVLLCGQLFLKRLIARPRPCQIDQAFPMLLVPPTSSSFPSTHTAWAFGAASAIYKNDRRTGLAAFVLALLVAFSRLYLFVHFPTDVLAGAAVGTVLGIASAKWSEHIRWGESVRRAESIRQDESIKRDGGSVPEETREEDSGKT